MPSKRRGGSWLPRLRAGADRDRCEREPRCPAAHAVPARPGGCSRGGRAGRGGGRGSHNSCRRPQRPEKGGGLPRAGSAAWSETPGSHEPRIIAAPPSRETWRRPLGTAATFCRRAVPSSRRRPLPPPWLVRPPALQGPGPLLPSRLLTALRRIPEGGCAAILSKLQSQDRLRQQPDWEARSPRRVSMFRPLPGRGRPREATPSHFRLGQRRIGIIGRGLPQLGDLLRAQHPGVGRMRGERAGVNSSSRGAGP